jgi:hypothetical protein
MHGLLVMPTVQTYVHTGLCEAICARATLQALESAEYADCLKAVVEKLPEQRLQVLPSAFPRSHLAWVGGSVFASLKVRETEAQHYVSPHCSLL